MLLAIDVGNTNTVLGLYRLATSSDPAAAALVADWRITTHRNPTVDEIGILFRDLFALRAIDPAQVTGVAVSSVVPPLDSTLRRAIELYFRVKPLFVEPGIRTGLPILTDNPAEVGADRIVNCVAAIDLVRQPSTSNVERTTVNVPIIVVDFGTATTFDAISAQGEYLGGAIAPGMLISLEALVARAAKLSRVDLVAPGSVIGRTTTASMQAGMVFGYVGLIEGLVQRMRDELGPGTRVIATGGIAELIASQTDCIEVIDQRLTLDGLRLIHELNS